MLQSIAERQGRLERRFVRWQPRTLDQMLDAAAEEFPDRPFVVTDDRSWTYREMHEESVRIAAGLVAAGVRPGDHVAMVMANYPEFVALKFAIARAGAVAVPVNFLNRRDELGYVLRQSDSVLLVTMDRFRQLDYLQMLDELSPGWEQHGGGDAFPALQRVVVFPTAQTGSRAGVQSFAQLATGVESATRIEHPGAATPSDIIYTSGTTGPPKGVVLTHDQLLRAAYGSAYARAFEEGRRILFSLPMYHVYGYVEGLLAVLFVGGSIVPQLRFDAVATLRGIERHRANDVLLIPTMTLAILDELPRGHFDLSSLQAIISSGGRAPEHLWREIFELMRPRELTTGYGMTEVTASSTVTRPDDPIERLQSTNGRLRDVGIAGDPSLEGKLVVYRVADLATGRELPRGETGELQAKGPGVTRGYYKKPEATAEAFTADGWLRTGDLGRLDDEGYLTLVGRCKESYRCGGEQVIPSEIEDVLVTHPAVAQAHVVPVPDRRMGEVGVAFVVLRNGMAVDPARLVEHCSARLARFKVPVKVLSIAVEDLPTTPSGRVRKFLLIDKAVAALGLA